MEQSILDKVIASQGTKEVSQIPWQEIYKEIVRPLLEKERGMLTMRHGLDGQPPKTLEEIGKTFQLTRERVRQIIKLALKKSRNELPKSESFVKLKQVIVVEIERYGGVVSTQRLTQLITHDQQEQLLLKFVLSEVGILGIEHLESNGQMKDALRLAHISLEAFLSLIQSIERIVSERGGVDEDVLFQELGGSEEFVHIVSLALNPDYKKEIFRNLLELSARMEHNALGAWGLGSDSLVVPRRVSDKIYLVLRHNGKPMHFRDITKSINEMKFDEKRAYLPTIHNELILDKRFVLVGRGLYALTEWGYVRGVVADVIENILREQGPLTRTHIEEGVLKQRMVKPGTIYLSLTNKKRFIKDKETGKYDVVQNQESGIKNQGLEGKGTKEQILS